MSRTMMDTKRKPKIALVVDLKGWAYWNIACKIQENLSKDYEIEVIPTEEFENNIIRLFFYLKSFDLVHFFWRGHLSLLEYQESYINSCGLTLSEFISRYVDTNKITTSVYDHLYLDDLYTTNLILNRCKNYTVSSNLLKNIYDDKNEIAKKPQMVITDGVDLTLFKPQKLDRFKKHKKLVVGWVGNSAWSNQIEDFKGFNTILKPVLNELIEDGYPIECCFADRQEGMIPHEEMPEYYSKIDVLLCSSKIEGTPNPVLEAMACGVPIISTNVGIVDDALGKKQHDYIVERNKEAFKEKIIALATDRSKLEELSSENLKQIKKWDWTFKIKDFKKFFDSNLNDLRLKK